MSDKETDLAVLIANLKGKKKKAWFTTAKACRNLLKIYNNSYKKLAKEVGVHPETIREVDSLNDLPEEAKKILLSKGQGLDKGYQVSTKIKDKKTQIEVAKAVANLGAHDARKIINYMLQNPEMSIKECKQRVLKSKKITEKVYAIVLPLNEKDFQILKRKSKKLKTSPGDLAKKIVENWIKKGKIND